MRTVVYKAQFNNVKFAIAEISYDGMQEKHYCAYLCPDDLIQKGLKIESTWGSRGVLDMDVHGDWSAVDNEVGWDYAHNWDYINHSDFTRTYKWHLADVITDVVKTLGNYFKVSSALTIAQIRSNVNVENVDDINKFFTTETNWPVI